jgi:hypothetical protein
VPLPCPAESCANLAFHRTSEDGFIHQSEVTV